MYACTMAVRIQPPRLSRADIEGLARGHAACDSAQSMLLSSKFPARDAVSQMVAQADQVICSLFNKAEKVMLAQVAAPAAETPSDSAPAASVGESAGQPEIAAPGPPEP